MSLSSCPKCLGYRTVCASCGKGRVRRDNGHRYCKRRGGIVSCSQHQLPNVRCDHCGLSADIVDDGRYSLPSGWTTRWPERIKTLYACASCSRDAAVMGDAIGNPMDMKTIGALALKNLISAMDRVDFSVMAPEDFEALRVAVADLELKIIAERARIQHAKRHPDAEAGL